ncbi:GEVED domain-containing protein [Chryseobacterium sp.]|uniref:GEVED domain-containing protein n=1 Tax=Chryseobacterium sp. TaxID=1871047 RepID=UPI0025BA1BE0|nr:GEVED domain-containing protein [Chryseobacterium sp.]MBV8328115.1 fibronectin type III domain-containing protein [Chryseobacterium sp.]
MVFGLFLQAQTVTIGTGTSTQRYPLGNYYGFERSASLYTATELSAPTGGSVLSVAWNATTASSTTVPVKIYLKSVPSTTTTLSSQNWAASTAGATLVYDGNITSLATGWNTFTLQNPFYYNGTDNLTVLVETSYGGSGTGTTGGAGITYSTATSRHMYIQGDSTAPTGTGTVVSTRPNLQITYGPAPACIPPGALSLGTVTATNAVINWTASSPAPAGGYDVYYSTTNTAPTAATVPLQTVTGPTATISPLLPNTTYYVWVRAKCSGTSQSWWVGAISLLTPPTCPPMPTGGSITIGTVTPTSAVVNWTAYSYTPAGGYDVYYSTTNTAPTAATVPSQTVTTGTSTTLSPLLPNTTYYVWVRARCSATDQSSWTGSTSLYTGYCIPTGGSSSTSYYLTSIKTTGGISNLNYTANSYQAYVNSTATPFSAIPGTTVNMNLAVGTSTYYYYVWVDWNNDMNFNGAGETILATPSYVTAASANIVIPSGQAPGNYRVRVATSYIGTLNSCGPASYGNYVDFNLNVIALQPCSASPPNNITVTSITASTALVSWIPATGASYVVRYKKLTDPTWTTLPVTAVLASNVTLSNLTDATQYEVQVATVCSGTQGAFSASTNFTTLALGYCDPSPVNTTSDGYINKVVVTPTNAPLMVSDSGYDVYKDYTTDPTRSIILVRGSAGNKISVNKYWPGSTSSYGVVAWIDYNRNGIFEPSEKVLDTASNTTTPVTNTFTLVGQPVYTGAQPTRMRVAMKQYAVPEPCGSFGQFDYGEVEDYSVRFIDQQPCTTAPPTNITVSNLTATSATFSWVATTGATYNLRYRKINPAGAYTTVNGITGNSYTIPNTAQLTEQTQYEVQVQTICSGSTGAFSTAVPFTTPPLSYCQMTGSGANDHISNVTVTSSNPGVPVMSNTSVQTNYIAYTSAQTLVTLDIGSNNNKISVAKGWTGATNNDAVAVWIDFDRDGQFTDAERILNTPANTTTPVTGTFSVPATAYTGPLTTTMRVVLKRTSAPVMCQNAVNGEVEDYRVQLRPCSTATPTLTTMVPTYNSVTINWTGMTNNVSYVVRYRVQNTTTWTEVYASALLGNVPLVVNGLTPATTYEVQVAALCGDTIGNATPIKTFTTRCDPTPPNVAISNITPTTALVTWSPLAASSTYIMRYRVYGSGATGWVTVNLPAPPANTYVLGTTTPLLPYTTYEVQIANQCVGESTPNPYSNPKVFTTERICEIPPPGLTITQLLPTKAEVKWDPFPGATYILRYRKVGIPSWTEVPTPVNNVVLTGLTELTKYEMQVANICSGGPGNFTPLYYFTTPTVMYCKMGSENAAGEHIAKVTVKPNGKPVMENASGASSYTDYTGVPAKFIEMIQGSADNEIIIEKKWTGTNYNEGIAVWIDFNRNGEFDINERVFTSPPNTTTPVSGKFSVPADAFVSMTDYKYVVMRVAMSRDGIPVSCVNFKNGEVEDYTVRITKPAVSNPLNQTDILIYPNPVSTVLYVKNISKKAKYKIYNAAGQLIADGILLNNQINVSKLINGVYVIDIDDNGNSAQKKFVKE